MGELTIEAGIARGLMRFAVSNGASQQALAERSGIDPAGLEDPDNRVPFVRYTGTLQRTERLRDSLDALRARLDSLPRNTPEYRDLYAAFSRLGDSLAAAQKRTEQARQALDRARGDFLDRSESLRAAIRNWEDSTYRGYDRITRGLATRRRQDPRTDTTGGDGWARFELPPGAWWIYGRSWDATDPNAEWYWNVPVTGDTLLLSSRTGKQRRRY